MNTASRVAGLVAGLTLTAGSLAVTATSFADGRGGAPEPCATQQTQLDRAEAKLADLTALFESKQARVERVKDRAEAADTAQERNAARKALRKAKAARAEAKGEKKAQQMRVAKAQARLDTCLAGQPTETPTEEPTTEAPTDAPT